MACVGVAGVLSEVLPLQRSYWVVLTVVIVLKPDFGSVFARAVQRGIGTVIGAVLGAAILAVVPYGQWLLLPFGVLAALLPYGKSRNFGLMSAFLTPLVVLFIDLLAPGGWRLAADRLLDTLLGCAIVLLVGYAPWPSSWQAHLPGQFASAVRDVCQYLRRALLAAWADPTGAATASTAGWSRQDRQAYRALSDLRAEFDRTMSEPRAISRRATAWWPAVVGVEAVADAITATAVAISRGAPAPRPAGVAQLGTALDVVADAVQAGEPPKTVELPADPALSQVTEAVRAVLGILASPKQPTTTDQDGPEASLFAPRVRALSGRETKQARKSCPSDLVRVARRKLDQLNQAVLLGDLRAPPSNRLEKLKGEREGQYSIRINDQWRVCFRWTESGAEDVEIADYH